MEKNGPILLWVDPDLGQTRTDLLGDCFSAVVLDDAAIAPQDVEDKQVRNGRAVGEAAAFQPGRSLSSELPTEFREEPRFADTRLADDAYRLPVTVLDLPQKVVQDRKIALAIDKSRRARHGRRAQCGARVRDLEQAKGQDLIGFALEDKGSDRLGPDIALRQTVGRFAQQDGPRLGCLLK